MLLFVIVSAIILIVRQQRSEKETVTSMVTENDLFPDATVTSTIEEADLFPNSSQDTYPENSNHTVMFIITCVVTVIALFVIFFKRAILIIFEHLKALL